jgi:lipopolysaccharide biosynthesis regulator YciM
MSKDSKIGSTIIDLAAAIGGAWLFVELVKAFGKTKTMYRCPNCNGAIEPLVGHCPHCRVKLSWPKEAYADEKKR